MKKRNYFEILNLSLDPLETNVDNALARLKQCTAEWSSAPQDDVLRKTWMEAVPEGSFKSSISSKAGRRSPEE